MFLPLQLTTGRPKRTRFFLNFFCRAITPASAIGYIFPSVPHSSFITHHSSFESITHGLYPYAGALRTPSAWDEGRQVGSRMNVTGVVGMSDRRGTCLEPKSSPRAAASQNQTSVLRFDVVPPASCRGHGRGCVLATRHSPLATGLGTACTDQVPASPWPCRLYGIPVGAPGRLLCSQSYGDSPLPAGAAEDRVLCTCEPLTGMPATQRLTGHLFSGRFPQTGTAKEVTQR